MSQSTKVLKEFGALSVQGGSLEQVNGSGALGGLSLASELSVVVTTGASTGTLADGSAGQKKTIVMSTDGGAYVLTPANYGNGTTLTFDDVGDSATLVWAAGNWWNVGTPTATVA